MCKKLSDWIRHASTGWVTLTTLVIFLLFTALVLPGQASQARADTGAAGSPDTSFFYTAGDLYRMAEAYGAQGRAAYVRARFTFDLIWPLVYMVFLSSGISWVYSKAFAPGSLWQRANLAPAWGALLDYMENMATSAVMIRYPSPTPVVDMLASALTICKWALIGSSFALLLVGVAAGAWRWIKAKSVP